MVAPNVKNPLAGELYRQAPVVLVAALCAALGAGRLVVSPDAKSRADADPVLMENRTHAKPGAPQDEASLAARC